MNKNKRLKSRVLIIPVYEYYLFIKTEKQENKKKYEKAFSTVSFTLHIITAA